MVMLAFEKVPSGRKSGVLRAVRRCQSAGPERRTRSLLTAEEFYDERPEQLGPAVQQSWPGSHGSASSAAGEPVWWER